MHIPLARGFGAALMMMMGLTIGMHHGRELGWEIPLHTYGVQVHGLAFGGGNIPSGIGYRRLYSWVCDAALHVKVLLLRARIELRDS